MKALVHLRVKNLPGHVWCTKDVLRKNTTADEETVTCRRCLAAVKRSRQQRTARWATR